MTSKFDVGDRVHCVKKIHPEQDVFIYPLKMTGTVTACYGWTIDNKDSYIYDIKLDRPVIEPVSNIEYQSVTREERYVFPIDSLGKLT